MKKIVCMAAFLFAHSFAECPVTPSVEGPVSHYGRLQVREGTPFIDGVKEGREDIRLVQVRGVSFGWARDNWESVHFYNANAVERLVKDWKVEILRAAYGQTNSLTSQAAIDNLERVRTVINAAIENDVYIIIDWHSHNAHLEAEKERAKQFFEEMAQEYGSCDGVIFELFNEPVCANGASSCMPADRTTWPQIKEYAEEVIPIIRAHSPNLILVGTPDWSQKVQDAIGNAIDDANVGYVVHFYSASHDLNLNANINRNHINRALDDALPVFVTEYGTTHSDGGCSPLVSTCNNNTNNYNTHNFARSEEWRKYLDSKRISYVAWNVNDKYEGSAFFGTVPLRGGETFDQSVTANWSDETKMTESGKYIFRKLNEYYKCVPWNLDRIPADCDGSTSVLPNNKPFLLQPGDIVEVYSLQGKKIGEFQGSIAEWKLNNGVYILVSRQNGVKQTKILRFFK